MLNCNVALVNMPLIQRGVSPAKTYHHVDLRTTLLEAAVALIGEVGPRAFTLREVARRAGVSHNAPYRHFAGKDELLAAVAAEGFDRLTAAMERAMKPGRTPLERLQLCGCGYVDFALRWPQHLLGCITAAQASGDLAPGDPLPQAWTAWSLVHGIAKLATSGNLPLGRRATLEFTRAATQAMYVGVAVKKKPR